MLCHTKIGSKENTLRGNTKAKAFSQQGQGSLLLQLKKKKKTFPKGKDRLIKVSSKPKHTNLEHGLQANTLACFCLLRKPFLNQAPCINLLSCHEFTVEPLPSTHQDCHTIEPSPKRSKPTVSTLLISY
jgi:hypothetical protein